jgi:hypothetical protein
VRFLEGDDVGPELALQRGDDVGPELALQRGDEC